MEKKDTLIPVAAGLLALGYGAYQFYQKRAKSIKNDEENSAEKISFVELMTSYSK